MEPVAELNLIAIDVGNSRIQAGLFASGQLAKTELIADKDLPGAVQSVTSWWTEITDQTRPVIVLSSVNDPTADRLESAIRDQLSIEVYRIGRDLAVPVGTQLDHETITGADRLLNAAAAYDNVKQACVVVDAGSAVTVDFVDGEGTFHGGAIAPGAQMQLDALHEHTADLPEITFRKPAVQTFGRNTAEAMLNGVYHGIRGMIWRLVEHYAERYGAFPMVIATGGDAHVLFDDDELVDRIVDNLTLFGVATSARYALSGDAQSE